MFTIPEIGNEIYYEKCKLINDLNFPVLKMGFAP